MGCSSSMGVDGRGIYVCGKVVVVCRVIFFLPLLLPLSLSLLLLSSSRLAAQEIPFSDLQCHHS